MVYCWKVNATEDAFATAVNMIGAFMSVIGSLATIFSFARSRDKKQQLNQYIFFLSVCDLIASLGILLSQIVVRWAPEINSMPFCISIRAVIQLTFLSSFCWTTAIAIHMYRAVNHLPAYKLIYIFFHVLSWGIPAVLVVAAIAKKVIVRATPVPWCDIQRDYEWPLWFGPMLATIVINLIIYFMILKSFRSRESNFQKKIEVVMIRRLSLYLLAFVLCWVWSVIGHIISQVSDHCAIYPIWILQDFFAPLQGFLNFIVYGLSNRMIFNCFKPKNTSHQDFVRNPRYIPEEQPLRMALDTDHSLNNL